MGKGGSLGLKPLPSLNQVGPGGSLVSGAIPTKPGLGPNIVTPSNVNPVGVMFGSPGKGSGSN